MCSGLDKPYTGNMARQNTQKISEITRQELVDRILMDTHGAFPGRFGLIPFLKRVWPLTQMSSTDSRFNDAEGDIWQHMVNNDDWTMHDLLVSRLKVYSGSGRYCVMFISAAYAEKVWPTHERRSAFEKAIESKEEYILPARFDDTDIPGLHKHIGYVDLRRKTPKELAKLIMQKLGHPTDESQNVDAAFKISDDDIPF